MTKDVKTKEMVDRVRQSQLGMFINLSTGGDPMLFPKLSDLAKDISLENNVDCRTEDLVEFYNLDAPIIKWDEVIETSAEDDI